MELLMETTCVLLLDHRPEELTIRMIADSAGLHHRYIPDYFGGKVELLSAIYERVADEAAETITIPPPADGIHQNTIRMARLAVWLSANHPAGVPATERRIEKQVTSRFIEIFGLSEETARLLFERLVALVVMFAAFPDVISPNPIDIQGHIALEVQLLVASGSSTDDPNLAVAPTHEGST